MSKLKQFLSKKENKDLANELLKCGSCSNSLIHCGKYEIISLLDEQEEGLLCETCKKNNRKIELVTRISNDNNNIFQIPVTELLEDDGTLTTDIIEEKPKLTTTKPDDNIKK